MLWKKKKSALTVRNTIIMTRSCSLFFKIFSSTRIHPQQESRGDPSSVLTLLRHHGLRGLWFPNWKCLLSEFPFLVCLWCTGSYCRQASAQLRPGLLTVLASAVADHGLQGPRASVLAAAGSRHRLRLMGSVALHDRDLPRPVALALQSRFVATGAPRSPGRILARLFQSLSCRSLLWRRR